MIGLILDQVRTLLQISIAGLRKRSLRAATTVAGAAGVVAMLVGLLSIAEGYSRVVQSTTTTDSVLVLMDGATAEVASSIPGDEVALLRKSEHVARGPDGQPVLSAEPFTTVKLPGRTPGTQLNVSFRGVEPAAYVLTGVTIIRGRAPVSGRREIIIGRLARGRLADIDLGSEIRVGNSPWRIVGEFSSDGGLAESEIWADAGALAATIDRAGSVQAVSLRLANEDGLAEFVRSVDEDPRLHVRAVSRKAYLAEQSDTLRQFLHVLCYGISFLMGLGAAFAAFGTSYASVASRIREIGTLKALGFYSQSLFVAVMAESLLLTAAGGIIGAAAAYVVFDGLQTSTVLHSSNHTQVAFAFAVSPWILVQAALLAVAIGLAGSIYPAWKVLGISIAQASAERR